MRRLTLILVSSFLLIFGSMAIAEEKEEVGPTSQGYYFDLTDYNVDLFTYPSTKPRPGTHFARRFPAVSTLRVMVTDESGNPVNDVPVTFEVEDGSQLEGMVQITPQRPTTTDGTAVATIRPTASATTGVGYVVARVGDKTDRVLVTLFQAPTAIPK